jgi:hypothetical protein
MTADFRHCCGDVRFTQRGAAVSNMESENYATISGFENLVTFEMQG